MSAKTVTIICAPVHAEAGSPFLSFDYPDPVYVKEIVADVMMSSQQFSPLMWMCCTLPSRAHDNLLYSRDVPKRAAPVSDSLGTSAESEYGGKGGGSHRDSCTDAHFLNAN